MAYIESMQLWALGDIKEVKEMGGYMGRFRRAYSDLPRKEALKKARDIRKRQGYKTKVRKDPNGRYEVWLG